MTVRRAAGACEATYENYPAFGAIGEITGYPYKKQPTLEMSRVMPVSHNRIAEVAAQDVLEVFRAVIRRSGGIESDCLEKREDFHEEVIVRLHEAHTYE